jgi:DNA primase
LSRERRLSRQEDERSATPVFVQASAARTTRPGETRETESESAEPAPKAGRATSAERNLLQILLADPGLVPTAAAAISPDELTHSGLRRLLAELYRSQAAGAVPDLDWLREQLLDRPDLFESAQKLQFVGHQIQERERWLGRLLQSFTHMKIEAEERALKQQLTGASPEQTVELLRKLHQLHEKKRSAG